MQFVSLMHARDTVVKKINADDNLLGYICWTITELLTNLDQLIITLTSNYSTPSSMLISRRL